MSELVDRCERCNQPLGDRWYEVDLKGSDLAPVEVDWFGYVCSNCVWQIRDLLDGRRLEEDLR